MRRALLNPLLLLWVFISPPLSAQETVYFGCGGHAVDAQLSGEKLTNQKTLTFPLEDGPKNNSILERYISRNEMDGFSFDGKRVKVHLDRFQDPGYANPLFLGRVTYLDGTEHRLDAGEVFYWTSPVEFAYLPTHPVKVPKTLLDRLKRHAYKAIRESIASVTKRPVTQEMSAIAFRAAVAPEGSMDLARIHLQCSTTVCLTGLYQNDSITPGFVDFDYLVDLKTGILIYEDWTWFPGKLQDSNFLFLQKGKRLYYITDFDCADGCGTSLLDITDKLPIPIEHLDRECYPAE